MSLPLLQLRGCLCKSTKVWLAGRREQAQRPLSIRIRGPPVGKSSLSLLMLDIYIRMGMTMTTSLPEVRRLIVATGMKGGSMADCSDCSRHPSSKTSDDLHSYPRSCRRGARHVQCGCRGLRPTRLTSSSQTRAVPPTTPPLPRSHLTPLSHLQWAPLPVLCPSSSSPTVGHVPKGASAQHAPMGC